VTVDIVLWGFITRYLDLITAGGHSFVPTLLGAVLLWDFLTRVMQGVTMAFFEDVWSRNFLNLFATPLSISEYVTGLVISSIVTSAVGLLVMFLVAALVFGLSITTYSITAVPFLLVLFLFGIALGIAGSALVLRLGPSAEWFIWPVPALLSPFAAVFYPLSTLPAWMRGIAHLLPPSYVFEGLRQALAGGGFPLRSLAEGAVLCGIQMLLACWFFVRIFRYAVRTGLLARYSAESAA